MFVEEKKVGEQQIDKIGQTLLAAADYIERYGWCQGAIMEGYRACVVGALYLAPRCGTVPEAYERLSIYLNTKDIPGWNDARGRTKEEVVCAMRGAAYVR